MSENCNKHIKIIHKSAGINNLLTIAILYAKFPRIFQQHAASPKDASPRSDHLKSQILAIPVQNVH